MLKERHRSLFYAYHGLHDSRRAWFDWRVRLVALALGFGALYLVFLFFNEQYSVTIISASGKAANVSELLFNTFVAGAILGMVLFAFIIEAEYFLGLRKAVYLAMSGKKEGMAAKEKGKSAFGSLWVKRGRK